LPSWLNFDYFSVVRLSSLILSLTISVYLFKITDRSHPTLLLAWTFLGAALFNLSMVLEFSSPCYWQPRNVKNIVVPLLQNIGPSIVAIFFLQFTYHFPFFIRKQRTEQRVLLSVYILVNLATLALSVYNFFFLEMRYSIYSFETVYYLVMYVSVSTQFILCVVLLFRKSVLLSKGKKRSVLSKLVKPLGNESRAAHSIALTWFIPLAAVIIFMASSFYRGLHPVIAAYLVWFGFLLFYCIFVVTYLNHTSERATLQVKLIGGSLVAIISILSVVAIIVGKTFERDYRDESFIKENQTILFVPNEYGSYDIDRRALQYEPDLGTREKIEPGAVKPFNLKFSFPYFGEMTDVVQVLDGPMVFLGETVREDGWGGFNPQPVIAPLIIYLDLSSGGGIFVRSEAQRFTVTWYEVPEVVLSEPNTIQLALKKDGSFLISYVKLGTPGAYRSVQLDVYYTANFKGRHPGTRSIAYEPKLTGIHPGGRGVPLEPISFVRDLPYSAHERTAIFEAYDMRYFRYIHERTAPLVVLLLVSCLSVLFFFPILFKTNLIQPLYSLYEGMRRVDSGDLDVEVSPQFNDEIGFLTRSFNRMVASIKEAEAKARYQQQQMMQMDKLTSLGVLVAGVAHEINNPNQTILSNSTFLRRACADIKAVLDDYQREYEEILIGGLEYSEFRNEFTEYIRIIEKCSRQIDQIVQSLKAFVRDEPGVLMGQVNINTVVRDSISLVSHFIKQSTDNFEVHLQSNLPVIKGHCQRLAQVIINLIQNACESLPDKSKIVSVISRYDTKKSSVLVEIRDEGIGISEEDLGRIQDPFFTTRRATGGTGLGLYVSEAIVQEHGGSLSFRSKRGEGTVATISLPAEGL
jgi:signal transduction histidine kinase